MDYKWCSLAATRQSALCQHHLRKEQAMAVDAVVNHACRCSASKQSRYETLNVSAVVLYGFPYCCSTISLV